MHEEGMKAGPEQVRIAVFAGMAELAGLRQIELPWQEGTVAELRRALADAHPAVAPLLARSAVAVGGRYATDDDRVAAGVDVAVIPPVSGG
jgi:molybdopterin converting factor small subunit